MSAPWTVYETTVTISDHLGLGITSHCGRALLLVYAAAWLAQAALGQYMITTVAGRDRAVGDGGAATEAWLYSPSGMAVDGAGNLYIADTENHRIRKVTPAGLITTVAGTTSQGFSGDGGPATAARLSQPAGVAIGRTGNLYIADMNNARVRMVDTAGVISTVASSLNTGLCGDRPAPYACLGAPTAIAIDGTGNLFVADKWNNCIRKVTPAGIITTVAGWGDPLVNSGFSGDGGPATAARLYNPAGLAIDGAGNLYIADTSNNRVRKVTPAGIITTVAGSGELTASGDGGPATAAGLYHPSSVAVDGAGNLYVVQTDNNRIRKVTSAGIITTVAGLESVALGRFFSPSGVAVDGAGNLYVAEAPVNSVYRLTSAGLVTIVAGSAYHLGSGLWAEGLKAVGQIGNGGRATAAHLNEPGGVVVDGAGNLYIADTENMLVRKVTPAGIITTVAGSLMDWGGFGEGDGDPATEATLWSPQGIALDATGNLYIADYGNDRVRKVSPSGTITTVAGIFGYFSSGFSGDGGSATAAYLNKPAGVALDKAGNLYIADQWNNRVRKVSPEGTITTVAGTGETGLRMRCPLGDGGPATTACLEMPSGVAVDGSGNLYIADRDNQRIRKVTPAGIISTVAGKEPGGMVVDKDGDGGPAAQAVLLFPTGIAVDGAGNLLIAEWGGNRIRKVNPAGIISTVAGHAWPADQAFAGDGGPATEADLLRPNGIAVDAAGRVYIADSANNRVRVLIPTGASCTYAVDPRGFTVAVAGGSVSATIRTDQSCAWAIPDLADWITISGSHFGTGPATVTLVVAPTQFGKRTAEISIAGVKVPVTQLDTGSLAGTPSINAGGVVNSASFSRELAGRLAPGGIATAYGSFPLNSPASAEGVPLPTNLSGLSLQFNGGVNAPLFYASSGQVNFQVPWEVAGASRASLAAIVNGQPSVAQAVYLDFSPGIFSVNGQGTGQGAILDASYRLVDSSNPAKAGSTVIQIYCTGLGGVSHQPATGSPAPYSPLAVTTITPLVRIGWVPATVLFSGLTPGTVGLYQVNVQVPATAPRGASVPVVINANQWDSNTVTIAVQ